MIGKTISHYKILKKLGEGGMGVVYKAEDIRLERTVALKFLTAQALGGEDEGARFVHEAKAAAALSHSNICHVYEIDESEGHAFIAMECIEGRSLKERIESGPLQPDEAIDIATQIAEGLKEAHEKGIVHRDVKPGNVMITPRGQAKIMDFGLAKSAARTTMTKDGTTLGTFAYMSPEQTRGEEVDERTDIWSLGVVLYEMLAGQRPFRGDYEQAVVFSILNSEPTPLSDHREDLPPELQSIVSKTLSKRPEERYSNLDDLLSDLKGPRQDKQAEVTAARGGGGLKPTKSARSGVGRSQEPRGPGGGRRLHVALAVIVVVAIGLIVGIRIQIGRQPPAEAAGDALAIMYFENLVDPEDEAKLGKIVTNLLIADLSESRYMRVVSAQRLYDILKLMGKEDVKTIDEDIAGEVAVKADAKWMLLGSILQVEPRLVIVGQLVDVKSGDAIAAQRITGREGEDVFELVDRLTVEIKRDLSLPEQALEEPDPRVRDVTTSSQEAYRYYLEAQALSDKTYNQEAEESFKKAVEADSTFAMAHFWLAYEAIVWGEDVEDARGHLEKAIQYAEGASEKERRYISALEAFDAKDYELWKDELDRILESDPNEKAAHWWMGFYCDSQGRKEEAVEHYQRVVEIDPMDKLGYNSLAYRYRDFGDVEKALWAINKYISLAPDEPNPYDSRGDFYAEDGRLDQAIGSYRMALEKKPDFDMSLAKLGLMLVFRSDYGQAEEVLRRLFLSGDKDVRSMGRWLLAIVPLYQGKYERALNVLAEGISTDEMEGYDGFWYGGKFLRRAFVYNEQGKGDLAIGECEAATERLGRVNPTVVKYMLGDVRPDYISLLCNNGRLDEARDVLRDLEEDAQGEDAFIESCYWSAAAYVRRAEGDAEGAVTCARKAVDVFPFYVFQDRYVLGKVLLEAGKLGEAVAELESALSGYGKQRAYMPVLSVRAHYLLALAYERSGWRDKAIARYEEYLNIMREADPGLAEVDDAKERLASLKGS